MKKRLLALLSVILVFTMISSFVACSEEPDTDTETETETVEATDAPTDAPTDEPTEGKPVLEKTTYDLVEDSKHFKFYGRMQEVTGGVTCDFTASGIEFSGYMKGDVKLTLNCDRDTYFTVYVDGVRKGNRTYATSTTKELVLATFAKEGEHTIRVLKQTEAQWSLTELQKVRVTGYLNDAPQNKDYYIEIIGDSITCGYGNLGTNSSPNPGTAVWEDGTKAFPFMTSENLGADCSVVGCSGVGIDKGWTSFSEADYYPKASYYRDKRDGTNVSYEFTRVPDIVIINLGTNDNAKGSAESGFKTKAKALIEYIRESYGKDVTIIWTYNMMGACCADWVLAVASEMGGESAGIYTVQLNQEKSGTNGHPTVAGHETATEILTAFIKSKNLLK